MPAGEIEIVIAAVEDNIFGREQAGAGDVAETDRGLRKAAALAN